MSHPTDSSGDDPIARARSAFDDDPSLHLTPSQAQRTFSATPSQTARALEYLQRCGYLRRTKEGVFVRNAAATGSRASSRAGVRPVPCAITPWRNRLMRRNAPRR